MSSPLNPISSQLVNKLLDPSTFAPTPFAPISTTQPYYPPPRSAAHTPFQNPITTANFYIPGQGLMQSPPTLVNLPSVSGNYGSFGVIGGNSGGSLPTAKFPSHLNHGSLSYLEHIPTASLLREPKVVASAVQTPFNNNIVFTQTTDNIISNDNQQMTQSLVTRPVILHDYRQGLKMPPATVINNTFQPTNSIVSYNYNSSHRQNALLSNQLTSQAAGISLHSGTEIIPPHPNQHLYGSIAGMQLLNSVKRIPSLQTIPEVYTASITEYAVATGVPIDNIIHPPSFQTPRGIITVTGPTQIVGGGIVPKNSCETFCPWWISYLIGLCVFVLLIGGLYYYFAVKKLEQYQKIKRRNRRIRRNKLLIRNKLLSHFNEQQEYEHQISGSKFDAHQHYVYLD